MKYDLKDISRSEIEQAIDEWILNERDRGILKRRLIDGLTYEALSCEFDLSVRHTKTIVYKCEDKLVRIINEYERENEVPEAMQILYDYLHDRQIKWAAKIKAKQESYK